MADEITTAAQLIELAQLHEIVLHEVVANRNPSPDPHTPGLPPDELHAPGKPDEDAAISFHTDVGRNRLGVRCRIETCNACGTFAVNGEAIFLLPAPIPPEKREIVQEFTEQVGAPSIFPYVRSAVASGGQHTNPTLVGGSDDEAADIIRCR